MSRQEGGGATAAVNRSDVGVLRGNGSGLVGEGMQGVPGERTSAR